LEEEFQQGVIDALRGERFSPESMKNTNAITEES
jgi:hypothetical protein